MAKHELRSHLSGEDDRISQILSGLNFSPDMAGAKTGTINIGTNQPTFLAQQFHRYGVIAEVKGAGGGTHVEIRDDLSMVLAALKKIGVHHNIVKEIGGAEGVETTFEALERRIDIRALNDGIRGRDIGLYLVSGISAYPQGRLLLCCADENDAHGLAGSVSKHAGGVDSEVMEGTFYITPEQRGTLQELGVRFADPLPATGRVNAHDQQTTFKRRAVGGR